MTRPAPRLVGVSGYANSGKSTFARALVEHDGYEVKSFAEPLRRMLYAQNPQVRGNHVGSFSVVELVDLYGWERAKDLYPEMRRLLQALGTDAGRKVLGEDVWVNATMKAVDRAALVRAGGLGSCTSNFVFPDVRFQNEFDAIKKRGGIVVRIEREGVGPLNDHESESAIDDAEFDYVIHNKGSVSDLRQQAFDVIAKEQGTYVWPKPIPAAKARVTDLITSSYADFTWSDVDADTVVVPDDMRVVRGGIGGGVIHLRKSGILADQYYEREMVDKPTSGKGILTDDALAKGEIIETENGFRINYTTGSSERAFS